MKDNRLAIRTRLIDEPIVEALLLNKYKDSDISFIKHTNYTECYSNGSKKTLVVKRNPSKHYLSSNFSMILDKNNLQLFNNSMYAFIDEVENSLYLVNSTALLEYILKNTSSITDSENSNLSLVLLPRKDIRDLVGYNIVKYDKKIAKLLSDGRDENKFSKFYLLDNLI